MGLMWVYHAVCICGLEVRINDSREHISMTLSCYIHSFNWCHLSQFDWKRLNISAALKQSKPCITRVICLPKAVIKNASLTWSRGIWLFRDFNNCRDLITYATVRVMYATLVFHFLKKLLADSARLFVIYSILRHLFALQGFIKNSRFKHISL